MMLICVSCQRTGLDDYPLMQCGIGVERQMQYRHMRCPTLKEFSKAIAQAAKAQADIDRAAFKKMEDEAAALVGPKKDK